MSKRREKKIQKIYESFGTYEERKLYQRAGKARRAAMESGAKRPRRKLRARDWCDYEDEPRAEEMRRVETTSIDEWAERLRRESGAQLELDSSAGADGLLDATLIAISSGLCHVQLDGGEEVAARIPPELAVLQSTDLAVGDRIALRDEGDGYALEAVAPRRTTLSRCGPGGRGAHIERVIAANVDRVVIVASARTPPLRTGLIDRYLIAVEQGGAEPAVCVNKIDLVPEDELDELRERIEPYRRLGLEVVECSTCGAPGVDAVRRAISGATSVFVGQSGVGKSSILNALAPMLDAPTSDVSTATGKGRHTTTSSRRYRLDGSTHIIDTPGIREFGLWHIEREELRFYFAEFDAASAECRYNDCLHAGEPECGVRDAVERGDIARERFAAYERILGSLEM